MDDEGTTFAATMRFILPLYLLLREFEAGTQCSTMERVAGTEGTAGTLKRVGRCMCQPVKCWCAPEIAHDRQGFRVRVGMPKAEGGV